MRSVEPGEICLSIAHTQTQTQTHTMIFHFIHRSNHDPWDHDRVSLRTPTLYFFLTFTYEFLVVVVMSTSEGTTQCVTTNSSFHFIQIISAQIALWNCLLKKHCSCKCNAKSM